MVEFIFNSINPALSRGERSTTWSLQDSTILNYRGIGWSFEASVVANFKRLTAFLKGRINRQRQCVRDPNLQVLTTLNWKSQYPTYLHQVFYR